jgi:hypothetical protein
MQVMKKLFLVIMILQCKQIMSIDIKESIFYLGAMFALTESKSYRFTNASDKKIQLSYVCNEWFASNNYNVLDSGHMMNLDGCDELGTIQADVLKENLFGSYIQDSSYYYASPTAQALKKSNNFLITTGACKGTDNMCGRSQYYKTSIFSKEVGIDEDLKVKRSLRGTIDPAISK